MQKRLLHLVWLVLLVPLFSQAAYFEAQGQAAIGNGDIAQAKAKATQAAMQQLLLYSGASVTSIQQMSGGLLTLDQLEIVTKGTLHNIKILQESQSLDFYTVRLAADVFVGSSQCSAAGARHSLLILAPQLRDQQQARIGQIYQLPESLGLRAYNLAREYSPSMLPIQASNLPINHYQSGKNTFAAIKNYAEKYDAQYLLALEIENLSLSGPYKPTFVQISYPERHFVMNARLYSVADLEEVYNKRVSVQSQWKFKSQEIVDPYSSKFWLSSYGQTVSAALKQVLGEVDSLLACQKLQAKIVTDLGDNRWQINIGSANSLQVGQQMKVQHQSFQWGDWDIPRQQRFDAGTDVTIEQVFQKSAVVKANDPSMADSIQLGDIVSR
ncbi:hypothetical protein DBZ36_03865 [Alginatibacterium sediminis]|uniref:Flagellar biosynthesis protein FlgT n=1 Tax=Alginatibacterium sediminis TaxID=2164068 RepID=A0A420EFX7_9ALTE|nr:flagellar assembly protein T N-terminal domain-containing protein [Alginatibacterium sediminis]RKF19612.1 hypothetical protein DBZ36_03865 [Alginatibacterium sediminis]